ncbi:AAA family ATPase, partial [Luteimonas sp. SDU101]
MNTTLPLFPEGRPIEPTAAAPDARGPDQASDQRDQRDAAAPPDHTRGLLQQLAKAGALRTLDHALAQSLRRLDPDTPDTVLAAAALASLAVASGHAGFDLAEPQRLVEASIDWPTPHAWQAALSSSRWVHQPTADDTESVPDAPLVYEHGLVYLRRYREYERRLAAGLRRIGNAAPAPSAAAPASATSGEAVPPSRIAGLDREEATTPALPLAGEDARSADGGNPAPPTDDLQTQAVAAALHHSLLLVTGGPGTGKTTTIARILVALIAQARAAGAPPPRIALAAPTGRAAERMA